MGNIGEKFCTILKNKPFHILFFYDKDYPSPNDNFDDDECYEEQEISENSIINCNILNS